MHKVWETGERGVILVVLTDIDFMVEDVSGDPAASRFFLAVAQTAEAAAAGIGAGGFAPLSTESHGTLSRAAHGCEGLRAA